MNNNIIEIKQLEKKYGNKEVLKGLNLTINSGQIVGLLGPNGCGKTTLLKTIVGLIKDYKGTVLIDGNAPNTYTKSIVSYLPEKTYLSNWMTVKDAFSLFSDFYTNFNIEKARDMAHSLQLEEKQKITTMSKGMQEKIQLILVMSREAKIYILDEPIGGVDPAARDYILSTILKNYSNESSILLSTHLIHDVERIFDKVLFLKDGKIELDEYVDTIREQKGLSIDALFREVYKI
ncbi:ABC transporter ATP-binding protein [Clostridium sp. MD294]|uniref:ABC transporter ATP-binding protein n=1 Tax=Clostridium sp. MD294 TaxID=97138 RepID=UPI0002CC2419|nr:ABC transporter ATP-binding protein [Clostridium sp. MD294]NDO47505.1 ABC transporter ATP-binding protein [Clostridium sp. MD294]USF29423.1 Multidrug efflux system ATP-binding protein [Clostridium sp. MD294]